MNADVSDQRHLFDLLERLLAYDPAMRLTLVDALRHLYFARMGAEQGTGGEEGRDRSHSASR